MTDTLKSIAPPRPLERERLAEAIERQADAVFQLDRVSDALVKLDDERRDALEPAVRRARQAVEVAVAAAPELLVATALGEPGGTDQATVAAAEAALKAADQALVDARQARSILRDESSRREHAADQARRAVDEAVKVVVAGDPQRAVLAEFNRAGRHLLRMSRILRTLGIVHTGITATDIGLSLRIGDVLMPGDHGRSLWTPEPAWAAALQALKVDADAEFPALPAPELDPEPAPAAAAA
jgi:hypothetical protein